MADAEEILFQQALAPVTRERYRRVWERYEAWCNELEEPPLPVTEEKAIGYVVTLACGGVKDGTVRHHLAGLRQAHLRAGLSAPNWGGMARLGQIRKGLSRFRATQEDSGMARDPVRRDHLEAMKAVWDAQGDRGTMLWAAACLCFFGCLRAGEALAPESGRFDPKAHLGWEDVMLDPAEKPEWIKVKIKESKTDRLRKGALITLCRTREPVCPVVALLKFMGLRKAGSGPFFRLTEGKGLDRKVFVQEVKEALRRSGRSAEGISGHSFRIGAATEASRNGASDEQIKALGRWSSRAYRGYVRTGDEAQAESARKLAVAIRKN